MIGRYIYSFWHNIFIITYLREKNMRTKTKNFNITLFEIFYSCKLRSGRKKFNKILMNRRPVLLISTLYTRLNAFVGSWNWFCLFHVSYSYFNRFRIIHKESFCPTSSLDYTYFLGILYQQVLHVDKWRLVSLHTYTYILCNYSYNGVERIQLAKRSGQKWKWKK